ncbi:MAG: hypothetical protein KKH98_08920 [Spirochaetes bacterium]|nr:hypothetical protein [Spirochaetota bacterium]
MKKLLVLTLTLAMVAGFTTMAKSATQDDIFLNITIVNSGLSIRSDFPDVNWGVPLGVFTISGPDYKGTIVNDGSDNADLSVQCITTNWTASTTTTPAANAFVLQGIFCVYDETLADANFANEDIVTATSTACSATAYAKNGGDAIRNGVNVPPGQILSMRFRFQPPTGASVGDQETVTVRVSAVTTP